MGGPQLFAIIQTTATNTKTIRLQSLTDEDGRRSWIGHPQIGHRGGRGRGGNCISMCVDEYDYDENEIVRALCMCTWADPNSSS